jgi:hypothetical protein
MCSAPFRIVPIPVEVVESARRILRDEFGHALQITTQPSPVPCRYTLRQMSPGEPVILMSYCPFRLAHPYVEVGPIFIGAETEPSYETVDRWPPQIDPVQRVFRAYDAAERIVDARVGGTDPAEIILDLFANSAVECIHVRALGYGCFTFKVERADER